MILTVFLKPVKVKTMKAFLITDADGGKDFSEIVFAEVFAVAKARVAKSLGVDEDVLLCSHKPEFDQYAPGPVPCNVLFENGWKFECSQCLHELDSDGCYHCAVAYYDPPEPVATDKDVFCSAQCQKDYAHDNEQRRIARESAL